MLYKAKSEFAGRVWLWAHQLQRLASGEILEIEYKGMTFKVKKEDIRSVSTMSKPTVNKMFGRTENQYGFDVNKFD